jgi:hypothetical protein
MPTPTIRDKTLTGTPACDAFDRNGFRVLVDDRQAASLDEQVTLRAESDVAFVRLTMLVGG